MIPIWMRSCGRTFVIAAFGISRCFAQTPTHKNVVVSAEQQTSAEVVHLTNGTLQIIPCAGEIVRITYVLGDTFPDLNNPAVPDSA